jgi:hypothetical protein
MLMACQTSESSHRAEAWAQRLQTLKQAQRLWDRTVRSELHRFADMHWPQHGWHKWISIPSYRLRQELHDEEVVWWVEQDIPPGDRFRCAAYRVHLRLAERDVPVACVQSGSRVIPVIPMSRANLHTALAEVQHDPALIIPRQMGDALDP